MFTNEIKISIDTFYTHKHFVLGILSDNISKAPFSSSEIKGNFKETSSLTSEPHKKSQYPL